MIMGSPPCDQELMDDPLRLLLAWLARSYPNLDPDTENMCITIHFHINRILCYYSALHESPFINLTIPPRTMMMALQTSLMVMLL